MGWTRTVWSPVAGWQKLHPFAGCKRFGGQDLRRQRSPGSELSRRAGGTLPPPPSLPLSLSPSLSLSLSGPARDAGLGLWARQGITAGLRVAAGPRLRDSDNGTGQRAAAGRAPDRGHVPRTAPCPAGPDPTRTPIRVGSDPPRGGGATTCFGKLSLSLPLSLSLSLSLVLSLFGPPPEAATACFWCGPMRRLVQRPDRISMRSGDRSGRIADIEGGKNISVECEQEGESAATNPSRGGARTDSDGRASESDSGRSEPDARRSDAGAGRRGTRARPARIPADPAQVTGGDSKVDPLSLSRSLSLYLSLSDSRSLARSLARWLALSLPLSLSDCLSLARSLAINEKTRSPLRLGPPLSEGHELSESMINSFPSR